MKWFKKDGPVDPLLKTRERIRENERIWWDELTSNVRTFETHEEFMRCQSKEYAIRVVRAAANLADAMQESFEERWPNI